MYDLVKVKMTEKEDLSEQIRSLSEQIRCLHQQINVLEQKIDNSNGVLINHILFVNGVFDAIKRP